MPSTFTARVVFITEASKMQDSGSADDEADAIRAVKECASSFQNEGIPPITYSDCIMTSKGGVVDDTINRKGTGSEVQLPCNHCGFFQYPKREQFSGWEKADDVLEARDSGAYHCVECGAIWSEEDRSKSIDKAEIVHKGEMINRKGKRSGKAKRTDILGLQWNALCSSLRSQGALDKQEWSATQSGDEKDEQALCNYAWAIPFTGESTDLSEIDATTIAGKVIK